MTNPLFSPMTGTRGDTEAKAKDTRTRIDTIRGIATGSAKIAAGARAAGNNFGLTPRINPWKDTCGEFHTAFCTYYILNC